MKIDGSDLPKIQSSLLAALLMTFVGAGAVYATLDATKTAKLAQASAQAQRNEIDRKLKRIFSEENEIKQDSALFNQLAERGVIGEEKRLDWIEQLKAIREKRKLFDLQYEIAPQRRLDTDAAKGFAFYSSTMRLQLKLLHEEDLTRLIDDLRERAHALIQVKHCDVSRLPQGATDGSTIAQLQADCRIDWITLREIKDAPETGQGK